jgi:hypothetical protein
VLGLDKMASLRLKAPPQACVADNFENCVGEYNDLLHHQPRAKPVGQYFRSRYTSPQTTMPIIMEDSNSNAERTLISGAESRSSLSLILKTSFRATRRVTIPIC